MRTREFPAERVRSGSGVSGPGYHTETLYVDDDHWDEDESGRAERRARCMAEYDALLTLLAGRWGEPQTVSLWSAQERMMAGEEIPEPWAESVAGCEFLQLWLVEGRWLAVTLYLAKDGPGCELGVVVTDVAPP